MKSIPKIKRFKAGDRVYVQAQRVWLVLVAHIMSANNHAGNVAKISYGQLAERMKKDPRAGRHLRTPLGIVGEFCKGNKLPTINSIVVNEETGYPGDHVVLRSGKTVEQEQAAVMKQNWFEFRVPTSGTLRKVWEAMRKP